MDYEVIVVESVKDIDDLRSGDSLVIEGLCKESIKDYFNFLLENDLLIYSESNIPIYIIPGKIMNEHSNLTGSNRYIDDLNIVAIKLDNLNIPAITITRFSFGGRWLSDVIDNNIRREEEKNGNFQENC